MADDGVVTDVRPTGRPNARMRQTIGDMVRSMLVVLAVVAVVLLVTWRPQPDPVRVVDTTPAVTAASAEAAFPVLVPSGLASGWRPTSARWEPTAKSGEEPVLHIGYVTPSDQYAQVSLSAATSEAYLLEQTDDGRPTGRTRTVAGQEWQEWEGVDRRSLLALSPQVSVVVSGGASWEELAALAGSLAPPA